jgi:transposase-like protein
MNSAGRLAEQDDESTSYRSFRFSKPIIQHAVWLYTRFTLSLRDVELEDLLAERGITVSYETIRVWVALVRTADRPTPQAAARSTER